VQPEIPDLLRKRENLAEDRRETEMRKIAGQPLSNTLIKVVDLLVESRIRIDAMEQILVKTNPVAYELYLGTIENLQAQKTAEVKKVLGRLESKLSEG
jgi:hypothetical protein